ncbi:hypothetical protein FACS189418_4260 [Clostridia bacterium]|nr:hypothetical protein FACS189418_4260 [Clostridia bacterium]
MIKRLIRPILLCVIPTTVLLPACMLNFGSNKQPKANKAIAQVSEAPLDIAARLN